MRWWLLAALLLCSPRPTRSSAGRKADIRGVAVLAPSLNLSWTLRGADGPGSGEVDFTLTWVHSQVSAWAAIGLHKDPRDSSMLEAEVFMCDAWDIKAKCQCRNTLGAYHGTPSLDAVQYLTNVTAASQGPLTAVSFTRTVKGNTEAELSVDLAYNTEMSVVFAAGPWMAGGPDMHRSVKGAALINFYNGTRR